MRRLLALAVLLVLAAIRPAPAETFAAHVMSVHDGDTFSVVRGDTSALLDIRLWAVDCPELGQAHGEEARLFTKAKLLDTTVLLTSHGTSWERIVCDTVLPSGEHLGDLLLAAGLGWWDWHYAQSQTQFGALETTAKSKRFGLWDDANQTPPWVWRDSTLPRRIATLRWDTHEWNLRFTTTRSQTIQWGGPQDLPVPADYLGTGSAQIAVFRPGSQEWFIRADNGTLNRYQWGGPGDQPVPGDYFGVGHAQVAIYRASTREWFIRNDDGTAEVRKFGNAWDIPVPALYPDPGP